MDGTDPRTWLPSGRRLMVLVAMLIATLTGTALATLSAQAADDPTAVSRQYGGTGTPTTTTVTTPPVIVPPVTTTVTTTVTTPPDGDVGGDTDTNPTTTPDDSPDTPDGGIAGEDDGDNAGSGDSGGDTPSATADERAEGSALPFTGLNLMTGLVLGLLLLAAGLGVRAYTQRRHSQV